MTTRSTTSNTPKAYSGKSTMLLPLFFDYVVQISGKMQGSAARMQKFYESIRGQNPKPKIGVRT